MRNMKLFMLLQQSWRGEWPILSYISEHQLGQLSEQLFFQSIHFHFNSFQRANFQNDNQFQSTFNYYLRCKKTFKGNSFHSLKCHRSNMKQSSKKQCMFMFYWLLCQPLKNNSCNHRHLKFNAPAAKANKSIQIQALPLAWNSKRKFTCTNFRYSKLQKHQF